MDGVQKQKNQSIFGQFNQKHNLRLAPLQWCGNCKNILEDIEDDGQLESYICPIQGGGDILINELICDKYEFTDEQPKKTERRKKHTSFVEQMELNFGIYESNEDDSLCLY